MGGLATSQLRASRRAGQQAGTGERLVALTSQRIFVFDRGALTRTVALRDVHRVEVKRALTNAFRRVLTVRTGDEVAVHLEGDQEQVEALARQAAEMAPAGTACLKVESPASILKLAPVALTPVAQEVAAVARDHRCASLTLL